MNKFILITLILSPNFLLPGKKFRTDKPTNRDKNPSPLNITPLDDLSIDELIKQIEESNKKDEPIAAPQKNTNHLQAAIKPPQWIIESSIDTAPTLLKNIFFYLQSRQQSINKSKQVTTIPSFHRFILVGPPGTGKTTLARSMGYKLNYTTIFTGATSLLGNFRNQTAKNIERFLLEHTADNMPKIIIIDELHKLFEHHTTDHSDDSQSAAAFWLTLDYIEKHKPNTIIICTANSVDKLPPEIKSRFSGKIITMPPLDKNQIIQAFKNRIINDESIVVDDSVTDAFIIKMLDQLQNSSLRDIQLIIDSAKIFSYDEQSEYITYFPIILTRNHFQQVLDQLQTEVKILESNFADTLCKKLQPWAIVFGVAANMCVLIRSSTELLTSDRLNKFFNTTLIRILS